MIVVYYTACCDGTYWRAEKNLQTNEETIEQISMNEYLDAMNETEWMEDWT
jgi:hypothetical protein